MGPQAEYKTATAESDGFDMILEKVKDLCAEKAYGVPYCFLEPERKLNLTDAIAFKFAAIVTEMK